MIVDVVLCIVVVLVLFVMVILVVVVNVLCYVNEGSECSNLNFYVEFVVVYDLVKFFLVLMELFKVILWLVSLFIEWVVCGIVDNIVFVSGFWVINFMMC